MFYHASSPHRDHDGRTYAIEVGDYFRNLRGEIAEWIFSATPPELCKELRRFKVPRFTQTVSQWLNLLLDTGFILERMAEPRPGEATVLANPRLQCAQVVAYFLHIRARKPNGSGAR